MDGLELNKTDGLELDRRNNSKYVYNHQPSDAQTSQIQLASEPGLPSKRVCSLRPITFVLSAALAIVVVLAVVAAAVGGSLAAKRDHCNTDGVAESTSSSIPNSAMTNFTSPATNSTTPILATSDCDKMNKIYVSTIGTHTEFNVYCESDLNTFTYLGVFVYTFEDCIESCASFNHFRTPNQTCHGVSFITDYYRNPQNLGGNCFVKKEGNAPMTHRANSSAATWIQS